MARFRGTVQGGRGEASRLGHKTTGLTVTAMGWGTGVVVEATVEDGVDKFAVYKVHSNGQRVLINKFYDKEENK